MQGEFIRPDWSAPRRVHALSTTRLGGVSTGPYTSLNLGEHVGDDPKAVTANRVRLQRECESQQELGVAAATPASANADRRLTT